MLLPLLLACTSGGTTYPGTRMDDYFPMDGERNATFVNDSDQIPFKLLMEKGSDSESIGDREVWTFELYQDDPFTQLGGVKWSVSTGDSTQIHGWAGADLQWTMYDPPISVTDDDGYMLSGDTVVTETGGTTFTSTYIGQDDITVAYGPEWEGAVHFSIDDGGGAVSAADPATRPIFVGEYWVVTRYMVAWMHTAGYDQKWDLLLHEYEE